MNVKTSLFILYFIFAIFSLEGHVRPAEIDRETWTALEPYFLPEDHPIKSGLDLLFQNSLVLKDKNSLKAYGFKKLNERKSGMIVTSHPKLKGYKLKLFLQESPVQEWLSFLKRIQGAQHIQAYIDVHKLESMFKVPHKWLYPLPDTACQSDAAFPKHFLLVVEDMNISTPQSNVDYYKEVITKKRIRALHQLIQENLLIDSIFIDNIPSCLDGKIAFIDTEHFMISTYPMRWIYLLLALEPKKRLYLQRLIDGK